MSGPKIDEPKEDLILELYKSHFTPKEISELLGVHRGTISYRFQGFRIAKVKQYDRLSLIPIDKLAQVNKEITKYESIESY